MHAKHDWLSELQAARTASDGSSSAQPIHFFLTIPSRTHGRATWVQRTSVKSTSEERWRSRSINSGALNGDVDDGHRGNARACRHPSCPCRPPARPLRRFENFGSATLALMRSFLLTLLIALLPLQFSWAAVASYCGHETQAGVEHFGPHTHQHHAEAGGNGQAESASGATTDEGKVKAPGAVELDCGHCHGYCCVISTLPCSLPEALPSAASLGLLDQAGSEHAPSRPERPQWVPLA